ncbi:trichome birefringence-like protein 2 [Tanacetum coccineum]
MATNDKESSATGTDNRPPMLEESDFESWKIHISIGYIRGKPLGKLIWKSIKNGPSPHPMITVTTGEGEQQTQVTREKTDEEFTEAENNKERADIQATNILSQGLPRHIFNTLNQTETAKEIWENVELLMQGSGLTEQQKKETLFDQYERFRANGNESIHDYFVRFHKLINDMKITKMEIPVHQRNTKFVNNLPSYWGKYVTIVKNSKDISTVSYVDLYTHLKSYEQHAMKTLSKMNQTSRNADPLAYMAQATQSTSSPSQYVPPPPQYAPAPQQAPQSTNDAMLATMNQIVNLLSGFQKQFPPTNNQLRTSTNPMTQATIQAGQITTENVQRRAPGNKGKHAGTGSQGKVVTCYNCRGQGHVARECKEKKRAKDSQWFKDKALLMEAKEKGAILDAKAKAFLADVECTTPYAEPLAITTTNHYHYVILKYHKRYTREKTTRLRCEISVITILDNLRLQLEGHIKTNEEQIFANDSLKADLERYKTQVQNLEQIKVKKDLEQLVDPMFASEPNEASGHRLYLNTNLQNGKFQQIVILLLTSNFLYHSNNSNAISVFSLYGHLGFKRTTSIHGESDTSLLRGLKVFELENLSRRPYSLHAFLIYDLEPLSIVFLTLSLLSEALKNLLLVDLDIRVAQSLSLNNELSTTLLAIAKERLKAAKQHNTVRENKDSYYLSDGVVNSLHRHRKEKQNWISCSHKFDSLYEFLTQEETQQDDSVPTPSNDPPLSGEDSMQLSELMLLCTNLQKRVLDLEKAKDAQAKEIADLKKRVQRLERKKKSRTTGLKRLKKGRRRIEDIDKDVDVSLVDDTHGRSNDADMFDIDDLHGDELNVDMPVGENQEQSVKERKVDTSVEGSAAPTTIEEITLAQTLIQIKAAKPKVVTTAATTTTTRPKARGVVVQKPSEFRTPQES